MSRRSNYVPKSCGWVTSLDMLQNAIESVDCTQGGAQEALQAMIDRYANDSWNIERRTFDMLFVNRSDERRMIVIVPNDPSKLKDEGTAYPQTLIPVLRDELKVTRVTNIVRARKAMR